MHIFMYKMYMILRDVYKCVYICMSFHLTPPTSIGNHLKFEIERNILLYNIAYTQSSLNSFYKFTCGKPSKKFLNDQRRRNMTL